MKTGPKLESKLMKELDDKSGTEQWYTFVADRLDTSKARKATR